MIYAKAYILQFLFTIHPLIIVYGVGKYPTASKCTENRLENVFPKKEQKERRTAEILTYVVHTSAGTIAIRTAKTNYFFSVVPQNEEKSY